MASVEVEGSRRSAVDPSQGETPQFLGKGKKAYRSFWTGASSNKLKDLEARWFNEHVLSEEGINEEEIRFEQTVYGGLGTVTLNAHEKEKPPLVMVHGYAQCNMYWSLCLRDLIPHFRVFLVELHGHGRSDRLRFPSRLSADEAETHMADYLERWREEHPSIKDEEEFVLIGHSLGSMVCWRYASLHPNRVKHLVLTSPVGVPQAPEDFEERIQTLPWYMKLLIKRWEKGTTPMAVIRSLGPFGFSMVRRIVKRRLSHFPETSRAFRVNVDLMINILHQSWSLPDSGERAMNAMLFPGAFAKRPLLSRVQAEEPTPHVPPAHVPLSMIYGETGIDWMTPSVGRELALCWNNREGSAYVNVCEVPNAGHMLALDNPDGFVELLLDELQQQPSQ